MRSDRASIGDQEEKENRLARLLAKKKNQKLKKGKKKGIYVGSRVGLGGVGLGEQSIRSGVARTNQYSKTSWALYLVHIPRQSSMTSFYVKGDNETSPSNLQVVLKVRSQHINEMCCVVQGTIQMSSYFRYEALYEKCGCPGSPSKVRWIKAAEHCG